MQHLQTFLFEHWQLWIAAVIVLLLILINEFFVRKHSPKGLSASAAVDMINHHHAVVIDIRDADPFRAGHIIDATRKTMDDIHEGRISSDKKTPVIIVCAQGMQSRTAAEKLKQQGFEQAMVLTGGIAAWQAAGLPTVKGN